MKVLNEQPDLGGSEVGLILRDLIGSPKRWNEKKDIEMKSYENLLKVDEYLLCSRGYER